jgi:hypothetical protein
MSFDLIDLSFQIVVLGEVRSATRLSCVLQVGACGLLGNVWAGEGFFELQESGDFGPGQAGGFLLTLLPSWPIVPVFG